MNEKSLTDDDQASEHPRHPMPVVPVALALIFPGLGHWLLGKRLRAAVFAGVILAALATGLMLDGELVFGLDPEIARAPLVSRVMTYVQLGVGLPFAILKLIGLGKGLPLAAGYIYGNTFLLTSGLMGWLTVIDAWDIASGRKG